MTNGGVSEKYTFKALQRVFDSIFMTHRHTILFRVRTMCPAAMPDYCTGESFDQSAGSML